MSVDALWNELLIGGWQQLSQWRVDSKTEGLHLDFKQGAFVGNDVRSDDRKNLAKGISGFANAEGGLLVFGAETARGPAKQDVLHALTGVEPLDHYTERLRLLVKASTTPPIPGVDVKEFEDPQRANVGVVVVRIPQTDGGPYRAEGPASDVSGKYFVRTTSDTVVMHHQQLAAMFGRRPHPQLRVGIEQQTGNKLLIHVENVGRGPAAAAFVRLRIDGQRPDNVNARGSWRDKKFDVIGAGRMMGFALAAGDLIYPAESRNAAAFTHTGEEREITVRVDCENAQPLEVTRRVRLEDKQTEWFGAPTAT